MKIRIFLIIVLLLLGFHKVSAQTTAFTYQGKLTDNGSPASGNYDLTFKLYDTATVGSGAQQGVTLSLTNVAVSGGVFTVTLDFGACASCFTGAARYLEISVKPTSGSTFTILSPRQAVTANPYAIKSLSAASADGLSVQCVSCVSSSQIQGVNGSAVNGAIPVASVPAGSGNYIQNGTSQQATSNFNISGDGTMGGTLTANSVNVNAGGITLNNNLLRLRGAADSNHGIVWSSVVDGPEFRAFSGFRWQNNSGGVLTERMRLDGAGNLGIGTSTPAYKLHVVGQNVRVEGDTTSTFPRFSWNFTGGGANERKWQAYAATRSLNFSALSDGESIETLWLQVLQDFLNIESVSFPQGRIGVGTLSPQAKLHIAHLNANSFQPTALRVETDLSSGAGGTVASFGDKGEFRIDSLGIPGGRFVVRENGTVVLGDCPGCFPVSDRLVVNGTIRLTNLGAGGSSSLCRNSSNQISACSSSLRYKQNILDYQPGLALIKKLRPVSFNWKADNQKDLGFIAEEVATVEPLLVTHNDRGEVEGVKYDHVGAVLVNAVKEQQTQIEALQKENLELKARLAVLEELMQQQLNKQIKNVVQKN